MATRRERLRYRFDNSMSKGTPALIGWLALVTVVMVVIFAGLSIVFADNDVHDSWYDALWGSLMRAMDPGTVAGDNEGSTIFTILGFAVTIGGLLIVSSLVGVLTTGLDNKLTELRKGRSRIVESGHTVLIGWSDQVFTIVPELVEANASEAKSCIAILGDGDKLEMEEELRARVGGTGKTRVVVRSGSTTEPTDLDLLSLDTARSVIVLSPAGDDPDAHVVKTLLGLTNRNWRRRRPPIIAAVTDTGNRVAVELAANGHAQVVDADDIAARLIVQTSRQSGLSVVVTDLLDFGGDEIYMRAEPKLTGFPYGEALFAYETASLIGIRRGDGSVVLNPPMETQVMAGDQMIVIAEDDSTVRLVRGFPPIVEQAITHPAREAAPPERTLMLGWNSRAPKIVAELDQYVAPGSILNVAAAVDESELAFELPNLALNAKECDTTDRITLESLEPGMFDHIIVLADDRLESQHADSRTLVTLLHLRDIASRTGQRFPIVSEMNDDRNRRLAQVTKADDFVVGTKLISLLMTQLSENPHLGAVFRYLFDADGSEIYLKPATDYIHPGMTVSFATVIASARARGETAIGYRLTVESTAPPNYGVVLNPGKSDPVTLGPRDLVIVLAED
ncbi:CASTOR/POLLUX-related putative ion channel [Nonomuraea aurantiaca]|jgi:voltage-gated potassium channel Kch|uniref:CASTOR/POLLUX-related putative ion channel n=1 Tax=Nonomuraea aurantiaca TaxID=2878562 RepID=UPI001CD9B2E8|nr:potassium transporter TrkA [Nonomuraea aurantiaca]MCA2223328.1 potassium transporter TrkA [Nonomuraea aurantiaca]